MGRDLEVNVSLITGVGFGMGREMAKVLARRRSSLVIVNRSVHPTEPVAAEVEAARGRAIACGRTSDRASCSTSAAFVADGGHTAG